MSLNRPPAIAGEGHKAAKEQVKQQKLAGISKVVGVSKLRTKYEAPEAKRQLCAAYDIFLADERIIPSLPKLLGRPFSHVPFPLSLSVALQSLRFNPAFAVKIYPLVFMVLKSKFRH